MDNFSKYKEALSVAEGSGGTAEEKYTAVTESLTYALNQLTAAWEKLVQTMDNSPILIGMTKITTLVTEHLPKIVGAVAAIIAISNAYKIPTLFSNFTGAFSPKGLLKGFTPEGRLMSSLEGSDSSRGLVASKITNPIVRAINRVREAIYKTTGYQSPTGASTTATPIFSKGRFSRGRIEGLYYKGRKYQQGEDGRWYSVTSKGKKSYLREGSKLSENLTRQQRELQTTSNWQTAGAAAAGGVLGAVGGAMAYGDWTTSGGQVRKGVGALAGGVSGALAAIPGWGMIAAAALQVANFVFQSVYKSEEEWRQQRAEQARKELETLGQITQSINSTLASAKKAIEDRTAEDYKTLRESVDQISKTLYEDKELWDEFANQLKSTSVEVEDALKALATGAGGAAEAAVALATAQQIRIAQETYAAQEDERFKLNEKMRRATSQEEFSQYAFSLSNLDKETRTEFLKASLISTGLSSMGETELGLYSPEAAMQVLAKNLVKIDDGFYQNFIYNKDGTLTDSFKQEVLAQLREDDRYKNLLNNTAMTYKQMGSQFSIAKGLVDWEYEEAVKNMAENLNLSAMAVETLRDQAKTGEQKLRDFAHTMGLTEEKAIELKESLENLTSADIMAGLTGAVSRYETIGKIFSELSKTSAISQESLNKVMNSYSWLMVGAGGISQENILTNIIDLVTNPNGEIQALMASQVVKDARSNEGVFKVFTTALQNDKMWSDLSSEVQARFLTSTTLEGVKDLVTKENKDYWDLWTQAVESSYSELDIYNQILQSAYNLQSKVLDQEISGFQSLKEALGSTNQLRERELNLIKARQALEDAKDERQLVYRAGLGWTYSANATAIAEAQENLDKLELETQQDNLQYQIDQLNTQKEILNYLQSADQWEQMEKIKESLSDKTSDGLYGWLASGKEGEFSQSITSAVREALGYQAESEGEIAKDETQEAIKAFEHFKEAKGEFFKVERSGKAEDILTATVTYNRALLDFQEKMKEADRKSLPAEDIEEMENAMAETVKKTLIYSDMLAYVQNAKDWVSFGLEGGAEEYLQSLGYNLDWIQKDIPYKETEREKAIKWIENNRRGAAYISPHATGTLDFQPNALINEEGTEAIVTPYGTLTALPTHSGIVPADLTSNLYALGKVAPNVIKELVSVREQKYNDSRNGVEDNSTNINNLNASFNVNENFDFDKFLAKAKSVVAISKHNK